MPIPDTLTKIRISGDVRHPLSGTPGTGTVEFELGYAMRDTGNNVIFGDTVIRATVTDGTFTTDEFVNPRQAGVTPQNQPISVRILTDVYADAYQIEIPADAAGTLQLAQLAPAENPPAVVTYALASQLANYLPLGGGQLSGAARWNGTPSGSGDLTPKSYVDTAIVEALATGLLPFLPKTGGTITGPITWNGTPSASGHLTTKAYVDSVAGGGAVASVNGQTGEVVLDAADVGALTQSAADERYEPLGSAIAANPLLGKTFCPEDYGDPVGDGIADDHASVLAAWNAMWAWLQAFPKKQNYANFYIPPDKHYRVDTSNGARLLTADQARAILPIPMIPRTGWTKKIVRIIGGGEHYVVRPAELGGQPEQVDPGSVLFFDSSATVHTWSSLLGLPCAIGATDSDMTDFEGNTFSNVHVTLQDITIRQNDNPSLCSVNLEQVSTARGERIRFDVETVLDAAPLCTNPTGAALLMPRSNNNVAISLDKAVFEGMYTGVPLTEHGSYGDLIALRCTIGIANRRPNSHQSLVRMLKIEQCPYGLAGYDPATTGVRTAYGWTGEITFLDFEDYAYQGEFPEIYAPLYPGAHFWDENNVITALVKMNRVNSEPASPTGVGVAPLGGTDSAYVRGAANKIALWDRKMESPIDRLNNDPTPPAEDERLFDGVDGPSGDFDNGGTAIVLGMEFRATSPREIKGLRYWRATAAMPANATGRLYKVTGGTPVAGTDVTFAAGSATGWIEALFAEPVDIVTGDNYEVAIRMPNGRYTATNSYWDSGAGALGRTSGGLRAENTHDTENAGQGSFVEGAMAFPSGNGNGTNYWVDVIATPVV